MQAMYLPMTYSISLILLLLDEKMSYLGCNFGGVSAIAEKNFDIGTHAFMAPTWSSCLSRTRQMRNTATSHLSCANEKGLSH